jgi:FkbM family methyltransferase
VKSVQNCAKRLIERVAGVELERLGRKSMLVVDPDKPDEAWYSLRATLRWVLQRYQVDHVLDVGANTGQFGQFMRLLYSGRMSSFEPVSSVFEQLQRATRDDPDWEAYQLALGSKTGVATIHVAPRSNFSSFLQANDFCVSRFGERSASTQDESVSVRRLDEVLGEISAQRADEKIYLKMDTQGFDMEVFKGLGNTLSRVVALQSEVSLIPIYESMPHWTESIAAFEQAGFGIAGMFPVNRAQGRVIEYDCVLTRI